MKADELTAPLSHSGDTKDCPLCARPETRAATAHTATNPVRTIINQLIAERKRQRLTQTEIARRCHLTPNAISQLERRNFAGTRVSTLLAYANAIGARITIETGDNGE